jgi:phosphoribosylformimino-5-aminoimidazole carboxamide ribotide isomerase
MTVYNENPLEVAKDFEKAGAEYIHLVDLEGAKLGTTPNINVIKNIVDNTNLFTEIGGGIRSMETVDAYLNAGLNRVIIGTAAVTNEDFLKEALKKYPQPGKIAVGIDLLDGYVAIKGWVEKSRYKAEEFFNKMTSLGVTTVICTDISKDGAMKGVNRELYKELSEKYSINITASGGVTNIDDIKALRKMNLYGAIIGKAYYTGAINLEEAIEVAK